NMDIYLIAGLDSCIQPLGTPVDRDLDRRVIEAHIRGMLGQPGPQRSSLGNAVLLQRLAVQQGGVDPNHTAAPPTAGPGTAVAAPAGESLGARSARAWSPAPGAHPA